MLNQMEPGYGDAEKRAIRDYLDSGGWLTEYENTRTFEDLVGDYVNSAYAHVACNGTIGLVVALMALDLGPGDEVVVPDLTHIATAYAVDIVGATPILVDVDRETLCLDPAQLRDALTVDMEAIVHVSLNGRSHGLDHVASIADQNDLHLVEDAAQSLGSRHGGAHLGTIGDVGVFSFSYAKIITTGQGGMIVTDDADISNRIEMIRDFGRPEAGVDDYDILGLNAKFTDLQAVIGIEQMDRLEERVAFKKELYMAYRDRLDDVSELRFPRTDVSETPPWFIDVIVESGDRAGLARHLESVDIHTRPFYPPIHTQGPYAERGGSYPNSTDISEKGLWLPSSPTLEDEDVELVCTTIREYFEE